MDAKKLGKLVLIVILLLFASRIAGTLLFAQMVEFFPASLSYSVFIINGLYVIAILWLLREHIAAGICIAALSFWHPVFAGVFYLIIIYFEDDMTKDNIRLIGKYALLLAIFYAAEYALGVYVSELETLPIDVSPFWRTYIPRAFGVLLNVVMAFIIYLDKERMGIETRFVMIATVLFKPIGVVAFLLCSMKSQGRPDYDDDENILDLPAQR